MARMAEKPVQGSPEEPNQWHAFFSEKDGREFFFDPVKNIATWFLPKEDDQSSEMGEPKEDDQTSETGEASDAEDEAIETESTRQIQNDSIEHIAEPVNEWLLYLKETGLRALESAEETVDDIKNNWKEIGLRALQSAEETGDEVKKNAKEHPRPWILIGVTLLCICLSIFLSNHGAVGTPIVHRGKVFVDVKHARRGLPNSNPVDLLKRVESSLKQTVGDSIGSQVIQNATVCQQVTKRDLKSTFQRSQEIFDRVELESLSLIESVEHNNIPRLDPRQTWINLKSVTADVRKRGSQWSTDVFDDIVL
jgi:hypothetical protein